MNSTVTSGTDVIMPINPLNPIDGIRKRPAMYIGPTDSFGLHNLAFMALDEFVSELLSGSGTQISVLITSDESLEVSDDGRPAVLDPLPQFPGQACFESAFTRLVGTSRFRGPKKYKGGACGLHTLSLTVVNALSEQLEAQTGDGQTISVLRFRQGEAAAKMTCTPGDTRGLKICFKPDRSIFSDTTFNQAAITSRLTELAALCLGVVIKFRDSRTGEQADFHFADGACGLVRLVNRTLNPAYNVIFAINHTSESLRLHIAFQHVREGGCRAMLYVNSLLTNEGGTHWEGFAAGLEAAVADLLDEESGDSASAITHEGLTAVVSVWVDDPMFEGATHNKLVVPQLYDTVKTVVQRQLTTQLAENPSLIDALLHRPRSAFIPIEREWTLRQIQEAMSQENDNLTSPA